MPDAHVELKQLSRTHLYAGRIIDLYVDDVEYPSGKKTVREVAHHPGGAAVVPLTDDGQVILVDQLRYPLARHILELPAGKLGPEKIRHTVPPANLKRRRAGLPVR